MNSAFDKPVLLTIFNKPEFIKEILIRLKKIKPMTLYVFSDGPRLENPTDRLLIEESRKLVESMVDWDCNLKKKYYEKNCGPGEGPYEAICWAFEKSEELIILEHDCIPSLAFFNYCKILLEKYKYDERIWIISGLNHFCGKYNLNAEESYFFSKYASIWGFATWKRCWADWNLTMNKYPNFKSQKYIFDHVNRSDSAAALKLYDTFYEQIKNSRKYNTWDAQFGFTIWSNRGVGIVPAKNLIHNVGVSGANTRKPSQFHLLPIEEKYEILKHPDFMQTNYIYDDKYFEVSRKDLLKKPAIKKIIINKLKNLLNKSESN